MTFAPFGGPRSARLRQRASPRELVARFICWHIQEQTFGGLDPATAKVLASREAISRQTGA
jgi:hypothetical protein